MKRKKAVVLLSGGLDSATTLFIAQSKGYQTHGLVFDYGQRHRKEIRQADLIARRTNTKFKLVHISLPWRGSALLDKSLPLPKNRNIIPKKIPSTYVPARNIIFLSFAASFAEAIGAEAIFIGANAVDYSGYPDCRPAFYAAYRRVLKTGMKAGVEGKAIKVFTPLLRKTKSQIIRTGLKLGVPYNLTWSCYKGGARPCGVCDSCVLRQRGFDEAGAEDPLL